MRTRDEICIGWISPGLVNHRFSMSVNILYRERPRVKALLDNKNSGLISRGRNEIVYQFLSTPCQWLLMLDADVELDLKGFDKLIAAAHDIERPVVSGVYFGLWPGDPWPLAVPLIFKANAGTTTFDSVWDYPADRVIEIDSAGGGCLLIHRGVLEKMRADASPHQSDKWCWFQDMPVNGAWYSEDHFFCSRVRENGYKIHAHTGVQLKHHKSLVVDERHHSPASWKDQKPVYGRP